MTKGKQVFKIEDRGFTCEAWYDADPNGHNAVIEVSRDGNVIRDFKYPAYRIWNIAAHFHDIVDSELEKSDRGYRMADWNGISGAVFILPKDAA